MRGERGQTAAEFMGMLLIACTIIATIAGTDLDTRIANQAKKVICELAQGDNCTVTRTASNRRPAIARPRPRAPAPPPAPPPRPPGAGPPAPAPPIRHGRPVLILPFPGSVSVACS